MNRTPCNYSALDKVFSIVYHKDDKDCIVIFLFNNNTFAKGYFMTNVSICAKNCLFAALIAASTSILPAAITADAAVYNQMTAAIENKLDYILAKESEELINRINSIFGDLACLIQADAITIADKEQKMSIITAITQTRMVINQLYRTFLNEPTLAQLNHTLKVLNLILRHLETSLKSDITKYQAFNPEDAVNRSKLTDTIDLDALKTDFNKTKEYTLQIKKIAENAGLSWYNHPYRVFDRFVIQPCNKYNLHGKAFLTAVALAGTSYVWYRLNTSIAGCSTYDAGKPATEDMADHQSWSEEDPLWKQLPWRAHDWINGNIRHYLGWPASVESGIDLRHSEEKRKQIYELGQSLENHIAKKDLLLAQLDPNTDNEALLKELQNNNIFIQSGFQQLAQLANVKTDKPRDKWLAHLEEEAHKLQLGWCAIGMTLFYMPFKDRVNAQIEDISTKITNNLNKLHAFLKGGAFYQQFKMTEHQYMIKPRFTFDDIIGHEHAKEKLSYIIKYIQDPENYDRAQLDPAKAILLYGPTRTGKSMIAEALAGEVQRIKGGNPENFPFYVIDARHIAFYGSFKFIMDIVKEKAPCIIFLDEIDMLNLHRGEFKDNNRLLSDFLSTLSGCLNNDPDKKVILLAATNTPENLDGSLLSRFETHIPFEYPSFLHRAEAILRELQGKGLPHEQFDIKKLAEQTETCSYEQLHKIINDAQMITRESGRPVTQLDIEHSINTILRNIIYHDYKDLPENELKVLSVHMTGHAMAYILTEGSEQFSQVTIRPVRSKIDKDFSAKNTYTKPIIKYGHIFTHAQGDSLKLTSKKDLKRKCMIELAGHIAEELILDTHFTTPHSCSGQDTTQAFNWAKKYVLDGVDEVLLQGSKSMQNKIIQDAYAFIETCKKELRTLFTEHKEVMVFIADILQKLTVLDADALKEAMNIHKMLDGKSLEEFFADLQKQAESSQTDAPQATSAVA